MIGVLIHLTQLIKSESIIKVLERRIPVDFLGASKKALGLGVKLVKNLDR